MLAKLLSLLLHAKSGAISGVLLLGATGALVSVSASNGVTTITITEASPDQSTEVTTTNTTLQPTTETETPKPPASPKLSSSLSTTACTDEATGLATEVQRVNSAFSGFHTGLMHLRGLRAAATIETADVTLKVIRKAAVKAIHATSTEACARQDDETDNEQTVENDTDENNDEDANDTDENDNDNDENDNDENDGDHGTTTVAPVTFTGTATEIADNAILLMGAAFHVADTATVLTPKSEHSSEQRTNDDKKHGSEHDD